MKKWLIGGAIVLLGAVTLSVVFADRLQSLLFSPTRSRIPSATQPSLNENSVATSAGESNATPQSNEPEVVASELQIPWELELLPDNSYLVTERPGNLIRITADGRERIPISGVRHVGEGGLLGMTLHPNFAENNWIYLYLTTQSDGGLINRVERYDFSLTANSLTNREGLLENIPGASNHDGGRIAFGPDNLLYITTGDAQSEQQAQSRDSLAGKILRLTDAGEVPSDNPFSTAVFAYGFRNPQGLAWDQQGRLWVTDHGPSGLQSGQDEVNLVEAGQNYGWPIIRGAQTRAEMIAPVIQSGTEETWAPGDSAIVGDRLFFTGLRGESLYSAQIVGNNLENVQAHFRSEFGRLRLVTASKDGQWLYISTSNTDGRGTAQPLDDRVLRVPLSAL